MKIIEIISKILAIPHLVQKGQASGKRAWHRRTIALACAMLTVFSTAFPATAQANRGPDFRVRKPIPKDLLPAARKPIGHKENHFATAEDALAKLRAAGISQRPVAPVPPSDPTALPHAMHGKLQIRKSIADWPKPSPQRRFIDIKKSSADSPTNTSSTGSDSHLKPVSWTSADLADNTVPGPDSLPELARSLKYNPDLMYEYVANNIDFVPTSGVQRGDYGTLMDGAGNDFDQCMLLMALFNSIPVAAHYQLGAVRYSGEDLANWLGITTTGANGSDTLSAVLANGGIPLYAPDESYVPIVTDPDTGDVLSADVWHMWVVANIGGTDYVFDPSFKQYTYTSGIDLATATEYDESSFISSAEVDAIGLPSTIQNVNRTNLRNSLVTDASNLIGWIKMHQPAASMSDIVGGRKIVEITQRVRQTSMPNVVYPGSSFNTMPDDYRTGLQIQFKGLNYAFRSDEIYGRAVTVFYDFGNYPHILLDGIDYTGPAPNPVTVDAYSPLTLTAFHNALPAADQTVVSQRYSTYPFLIGINFGTCSRQMVQHHRELVLQLRDAGFNELGADIFGEELAIEFYTHCAETTKVNGLADQIHRCINVFQHEGGVASYEGTPGFDLGLVLSGCSSRDLSDSTIDPVACSFNFTIQASGLESAAHQQLHDANATSTGVMFDVANSASQIFYAINSEAEWNTISSSQLTNYSQGTLDYISSFIHQGYRAIVPKNGIINKDSWHSYAFLLFDPSRKSIGMLVGPQPMFGGQCTTATPLSNTAKQQPEKDCPCPGMCLARSSSAKPRVSNALDPVDMFYGNWMYNHRDVSVGSGDFPYELSFDRMYDSSMKHMDGSLGRGWMHGLQWAAFADSDGFQALGEDSPIDAAATITQMFINSRLLADTSYPLDKFTLAMLNNAWYVDQISNNTVVISTPDALKTFVKLPNGNYNPPRNDASTLTQPGSFYVYTTPQQVIFTFDTDGNLSTMAYPSGAVVTLTYVGGRLTSIANNTGRTLNLTYTGDLIASVADGTGRSVSYSYNSDDELTSFTDANGKVTSYEYTPFVPGELTRYFLPAHPTTPAVETFYDSLGRVASQFDPYGNYTLAFFAGNRSEEIDRVGNSHVVYFDDVGNILRDIDALHNETKHQYDGLHRETLMTLPEGNSFEYSWDDQNNLTKIESFPKPGSGLSSITQTFTYDPDFNKLATSTDGNLNTTTFGYNATTGNLETITRPTVSAGTPVVHIAWNSTGLPISVIDETNRETDFTYSATNETLESVIQDPGGVGHLNLTTQFGYNTVGDITSVTDANSHTTTFVVDALRRTTQRIEAAPFNFVTKFNYDDNSNLISIQRQTDDPLNPWQTFATTFSISDQPLQISDPAGNATVLQYDLKDRVASETDAEGRTYQFRYDPQDRVASVTRPNGERGESFAYTPNSLLASIVDTKGYKTSYTFDGFDRFKRRIFADGTFEENTLYDSNDNLLTFTTASGKTIGLAVDALDRVTSKSPQDQPTVSYSYDLAHRLLSASTPLVAGDLSSGTYSFSWDGAGRLISEETSDSKVLSYELDGVGNTMKLTYPDGFFVSYLFDSLDRLTDVRLNGAADSFAHYGYDSLSRRIHEMFFNGAHTEALFSNSNDLLSLRSTFNPSRSLKLLYSYNKAHELIEQTVSDPTILAQADRESPASYSANNLNQYDHINGDPVFYDGNGNLTAMNQASFSFDTESRLTGITGAEGTISLSYDPLGRLAVETASGSGVRYVGSRLRPIATYANPSGTLLEHDIPGPSFMEQVGQSTASGDLIVQHRDRLASIVTTSTTGGQIVAEHSFSPFGQFELVAGTSNRSRFATIDIHQNSGLGLTMSRAYVPSLGRWLSRDPLREAGDSNLYRYVNNSPLSFLDPYGLKLWFAIRDESMLNAMLRIIEQLKTSGPPDLKAAIKKLESPDLNYTIADDMEPLQNYEPLTNLGPAGPVTHFNPYYGFERGKTLVPPDEILAHELMHALDIVNGRPLDYGNPAYEKNPTDCENRYRKSKGLKPVPFEERNDFNPVDVRTKR